MNRIWLRILNNHPISLRILYALLSFGFVLYIPTLVPGSFVSSESYIFGYNNRIGILLILILIGLNILLFRPREANRPILLSSDSVHSITIWSCVGIVGTLGLGMYILTSRFGSFGESIYFINRIGLATHNLRPYRDFEFAYGAIFIYGPLLIHNFLHISVPAAYYLFWIVNLMLGTWFTAEVVKQLDFPGKYRNAIFIFFFIATLSCVITAGVNYTGFRFALGPLFGILLVRTIKEGRSNSNFRGLAVIFFSTVSLLLISPEVAVAFAFGASLFITVYHYQSKVKYWFVPCALEYILIGSLFIVANHLMVFESFKRVSGGGYFFPIMPAPCILLFVVSLYYCARMAIMDIAKHDFRSNYHCVLLISFPMIFPALGRCDPYHILFDGMSIFILAFLAASQSPREWKWYRFTFVSVFIILAGFSMLTLYRSDLLLAAISRSSSTPEEMKASSFYKLFAKRYPDKIGKMENKLLERFSKYDDGIPSHMNSPIFAPFGYYSNAAPSLLQSGYYLALVMVIDSRSVNKKIAELANHPDANLLLPRNFIDLCSIDPEGSKQMMRKLFMYPYNGHAVHTQSVYEPLYNYIISNYTIFTPPQPVPSNYQLWEPKAKAM